MYGTRTVKADAKGRGIVPAVVIVLLTVVGCAAAFWWLFVHPHRTWMRTAEGLVGQPEAEVIRALGPPRFVVTADSLDGRTVDYPWRGMDFTPVPDRPVRNKVFLYSRVGDALYVYIGENGRMEAIEKAGT